MLNVAGRVFSCCPLVGPMHVQICLETCACYWQAPDAVALLLCGVTLTRWGRGAALYVSLTAFIFVNFQARNKCPLLHRCSDTRFRTWIPHTHSSLTLLPDLDLTPHHHHTRQARDPATTLPCCAPALARAPVELRRHLPAAHPDQVPCKVRQVLLPCCACCAAQRGQRAPPHHKVRMAGARVDQVLGGHATVVEQPVHLAALKPVL